MHEKLEEFLKEKKTRNNDYITKKSKTFVSC